MPLSYPHTIVVRRYALTQTATGSTEGAATTIYSGRADVQEAARHQITTSGALARLGDAEVYVPGDLPAIKTGDGVTVTYPDATTRTGRIAEVRRLDDSFILAFDPSTL